MLSDSPSPVRGRFVFSLTAFALVMGLLLLDADMATAQKSRKSKKKPAKKKVEVPDVPARRIKIDSVDAKTLKQVQASARKIDALVKANYKKYKVKPNETTSEAQFVRRAYVDITGTIPTYQQARMFVASRIKDKRARLIDTLLNSKGYSSNFYNYWADLLRVTERLTNQLPAVAYSEWIKQSLEENKPYDEFVYEMLSASGKVWDNPAAGYYLRDSGMPLDNMNNTIRIFLGTRIGCAQCHDHPFDRWTRKEFYEIASFTYGAVTRRSARDKQMFGGKHVVNSIRAGLKEMDPKYGNGGKYNRLLNGNLSEVYDAAYRKLRFPDDYSYDDAKPKQLVTPTTLFGPKAEIKKGETPRMAFARWVTSDENPRFAKAIANRLWKQLMGVGLIEPADDIKDESIAENPELMEFLTSEMIRVKYDMKEFLRILLNTQVYQRQATFAEINPAADEYHFPGPILRRMTAEQVWDSFITLATFSPENYQREPARVKAKFMNIDLAKATPKEVFDNYAQYTTNRSYKTRQARDKSRTHEGMLLARASELPTPVSPGHFVRQFGQSDRELIQGSSTDGSVPQILQMFNGTVTHMILDERSKMYENVAKQRDAERRIEVIFLSVLSRKPSSRELKIAREEIQANKSTGYGNVTWALVNTREFLFLQ